MPQIGPLEILMVAAIALLVFGPEKLPEIARNVGKGIAEVRRMASSFRDDFETGMNVDDEWDGEPGEEEAATPAHPVATVLANPPGKPASEGPAGAPREGEHPEGPERDPDA